MRTAVAKHAGHPAIFGYLVGNEISTTMVRWLGVRRVTEFLEHLIRVGRAGRSRTSSFPTRVIRRPNFSCPQNVDFFCFNVYLHDQRDFERYLLRLQNLAEDRPLILGEFGMDTIRHSEDEQAEMLGWHVDSVVKCGLAGTIFFSWTDEWFTGEQEITDWAFGLVTRDRAAEESLSHAARQTWAGQRRACRIVALPQTPFGLGHRVFLQWRQDAGRLPRVVRQNRLSGLRNHPGRRRLDR